MAGFRVDMSPLERSSMNIGRSLMGVGQTIADSRQQSQQDQEQGDIEAFMRQAMSGDQRALEELMVKSPQAAQMVAQHIQSQQAGEQAEQDRYTGEIANNTAGFIEQMHTAPQEQQEAMFNAAIDDPRFDIDEEDRNLFMDVNARKAIVGKVKGEEYAENFFGGGDKAAELPADTIGFNDLIKDFTPKQKKLAKQVKAGIKGRAVSNAELSAIQSGEIDNYGKWKVQQRQAEKFAELTGSSRAKAIDSGIEKISKIDVGLSNIDAAIQAINDGAGTGAIERRFPSIKAASVALDNIQGKMALDVIGAVTFGALSQGELDLAREVALPTGLEAPELIQYLNDKKVAQKKLRDYYNDQIQFLDQGGTIAGFMRQQERSTQEQPQPTDIDTQALEWAQANPNDPRATAILKKQGKL